MLYFYSALKPFVCRDFSERQNSENNKSDSHSKACSFYFNLWSVSVIDDFVHNDKMPMTDYSPTLSPVCPPQKSNTQMKKQTKKNIKMKNK